MISLGGLELDYSTTLHLPETDFPLSGDEATERFIAGTADVLKPLVASRSEFYRMDTLRRID